MDPSGDAFEVLRRLEHTLAERRRTTIGELVDALGPTGFPVLFIVLALPALIPVPGPWGMLFGIALTIAAVQCAFGAERLRVPARLAAREVPAGALGAVLRRALPLLERVRGHFRAGRRPELVGDGARRIAAALVALLAVAMALPIPFGNVPPVVAIVALSLALLVRDGLALAFAGVVGIAAMSWSIALVFVGAALLDGIVDFLGARLA